MTNRTESQQALNRAMLEAVDFVHAEGWDQPPTLFGLVPSELMEDHVPEAETNPLTLVVQDTLPGTILPGSNELLDYLSRTVWPPQVVGVALAQEIVFRDSAAEPEDLPHDDDLPAGTYRARLFSGVLRSGAHLTLLQRRPTSEELERGGKFTQDDVELRGGPNVAPEVLAVLRASLDQDPAEFLD